jgi:hypothetical protein
MGDGRELEEEGAGDAAETETVRSVFRETRSSSNFSNMWLNFDSVSDASAVNE